VAVPRRRAEHRFGIASDVDRQWLLHPPGRNVDLRDLVVLAVVTEEILRR
jgi:hypothetical protein